MARITTPVPGYSGQGPGNLHFSNGVAETDDPATIDYCRSAGYGIDGEPPQRQAPDVPDPREVTDTQLGAPLRDAAVDPHEDDFRAPIGAGEGNPHGPEVYAPGLPGGPVQPQQVEGQPDGAQDEEEPSRPSQAAPVAEWRAYAAAVASTDKERDATEKATKAELVKKYGG